MKINYYSRSAKSGGKFFPSKDVSGFSFAGSFGCLSVFERLAVEGYEAFA